MEPERGEDRRPFLARRLADDADLLAEVETAEKLGISLKRFRGWEPTTIYDYADGVLVSSRPETEWDETEQAWILALRLYRESLCPKCTGDLTETTDAANEDKYKPELPVQCFRCVAFTRSYEAYQGDPYNETLIHLVPRRPVR